MASDGKKPNTYPYWEGIVFLENTNLGNLFNKEQYMLALVQ